VGLDRLSTVASAPEPDLDVLLTSLIIELTGERAEDDVALLAFRWATPTSDVTAGVEGPVRSQSAAAG
jgi:hypothetical protein